MGYSVFGAQGFVADVASNSGWVDFARWARAQGGPLRDLIENGWTEDRTGLIAQAGKLKPRTRSDASVLSGLRDAAERAEDVVIVTDGVGEEPT